MHTFYIQRCLPFSLLDAVQEVLMHWGIQVIAIDGMSLDTMYEPDKEALATREDSRFLFTVEAVDLEAAGSAVDEMIEEVYELLDTVATRAASALTT